MVGPRGGGILSHFQAWPAESQEPRLDNQVLTGNLPYHRLWGVPQFPDTVDVYPSRFLNSSWSNPSNEACLLWEILPGADVPENIKGVFKAPSPHYVGNSAKGLSIHERIKKNNF